MNKKLLIGIIAGVVAVGAVIIGVLIGTSQNNAQNCKHEDPAKIVVVEAVAPTCQKTGLTEGKKCTNCGTMVLPQSIVQTIECIEESDWILDIAATHTEDGKHHTECTMCGKLFREEVVLSGNKQLKYTLLYNGTYEVSGIGNCKDKNIVIPSEYNGLPVTSIEYGAFYGCTSLTSIEIPDSVTSIGGQAFWGCSSLTSIEIPDSVTSIGDNAFYRCESLTSIEIPDSVTNVGNYAFAVCTSLTSITIPDSVTSIGDCAFYGCSSLTGIEIPDTVTSIGEYAFAWCSSLTIYCEAASKPSGWSNSWNYSNRPVVWGYTGE